MKKQWIIALFCLIPLLVTACAKKTEEVTDPAASIVVDDKPTSAEQQAQINALDKPVLDEKNTDVKNVDVASEAKNP